MAALGHDCLTRSDKKINDGPVGFFGMAFGAGMDSKCDSTVKAILARQATVVNLAGHSRGGVLCYMIANGLAAKKFPGQVNIVVLDPVNMSSHTQKATELRQGITLGLHVAIVMENVTNILFPLTEVKPLNVQFRQKMITYSMPGTHGSGTQPATSAIGKAVKGMIMFLMDRWGTSFGEPTPSLMELLEAFAAIHDENAVHYDEKTGLVKDRLIWDDKKGFGKSKDFSGAYQSVGRHEQIGTIVTGTDFRDSPYFFNDFHAACFQVTFPAIWARLVGGPAYWAREDPKKGGRRDAHLRELTADITKMNGCPNLKKSLAKLGMLD
jgi:hypothetical protein